MKKVVLAAIAATSLLVSASSFAGDAGKGKAAYAAKCASCHGKDGHSAVPMYPKLAGQHEAYIVKQIKAFQSGERKDPVMTAMAGLVQGAEIDNVAAFLASVK